MTNGRIPAQWVDAMTHRYKPSDYVSVMDLPRTPDPALGRSEAIDPVDLALPLALVPAMAKGVGAKLLGGLGLMTSGDAEAGTWLAKEALSKLSPIRPQRVATQPKIITAAQSLRGGEQPVEQLLNQLLGKPGTKVSDLQLWKHLQKGEKMSPTQLAAQANPPKLYAQRGAAKRMVPHPDEVDELAESIAWGPEMARQNAEILRGILVEKLGGQELSRGDARAAKKALSSLESLLSQADADEESLLNAVLRSLEDLEDRGDMGEFINAELEHRALGVAYDMAESRLTSTPRKFTPQFGEFQRQPESVELGNLGGEYFETVLRGPPSAGRAEKLSLLGGHGWRGLQPYEYADYHFGNQAQLGHIRGTVGPNAGELLIDEIQSDPLKALGAKAPGIESIYGKLGNMVIDRAAAADIPEVRVPSGARAASARESVGRQREFMERLYDKELGKQLYEPLQRKGIPMFEEDGYRYIELSPAAREAIRKGEVLNYRRGGLAALRNRQTKA